MFIMAPLWRGSAGLQLSSPQSQVQQLTLAHRQQLAACRVPAKRRMPALAETLQKRRGMIVWHGGFRW
ncbi:hypothetical protein OOZ63_13710 [Paucibacter sp. PLA-PC-4]|nr:hypothetical protein [Paucibacter sp. PLA-PC-4]MCX2862889.1 hypothetical protein [Paucibacter sp. PLA-PC-4]